MILCLMYLAMQQGVSMSVQYARVWRFSIWQNVHMWQQHFT